VTKYGPGEYIVTLKGSSGTVTPVSELAVFKLVLVNSCDTATIKNLQKVPFEDIEYFLGQ